jgi:hypothetical protein
MLLLGAGVTWSYCRAMAGGAAAVIIFAILFYGVLLSGYAENFLLNLNFLAKMLIFTFVCYGFSSQRPKRTLQC